MLNSLIKKKKITNYKTKNNIVLLNNVRVLFSNQLLFIFMIAILPVVGGKRLILSIVMFGS